ncbi:MAG: RdgB/HAM1 family non-canonical purine NTP pyrophosphatase [Chloroflexota bacterium]
MLQLLLATGNPGKVIEYRSLLQGISFQLVTPAEVGITTEVQETGSSLEENARLKAVTLSGLSHLITLADDSGLEVDALGGAPGHLSARYAGEHATDEERVSYLLSRLGDVPWEKRTACFRCVIAIATPDGSVTFCSGKCPGVIAFAPKGEKGFGYDPLFYFPELDRTMAELPMTAKNRISHRGRAARAAREVLIGLASRDNHETAPAAG